MRPLKKLSIVETGNVLYLLEEFYILVKKKDRMVEGVVISMHQNSTIGFNLGDIIIISNSDLDYESWYKLNNIEAQEIKLLAL